MILAAISPLWGIAAALVGVAGAIVGQAVARLRDNRDRRRDEYSRAFATALEWREFPYRVARRLSNEASDVRPIIDAMHTAQTQMYFHQAWLESSSKPVADAYASLCRAVKAQTAPHLGEAWRREPWKPQGEPVGLIFSTDLRTEIDAFRAAVQRDVSMIRRLRD